VIPFSLTRILTKKNPLFLSFFPFFGSIASIGWTISKKRNTVQFFFIFSTILPCFIIVF